MYAATFSASSPDARPGVVLGHRLGDQPGELRRPTGRPRAACGYSSRPFARRPVARGALLPVDLLAGPGLVGEHRLREHDQRECDDRDLRVTQTFSGGLHRNLTPGGGGLCGIVPRDRTLRGRKELGAGKGAASSGRRRRASLVGVYCSRKGFCHPVPKTEKKGRRFRTPSQTISWITLPSTNVSRSLRPRWG